MSNNDISPAQLSHSKARYSIDLSFDLENRLNDLHDGEMPNSPTATDPMPALLDPDVLTSIVVQLRATLAQAHQERDDLTASLVHAHARSADLEARSANLTEMLETETAKSTSLESQLAETQKRCQENEDQVNMLRSKVEESRRGVMRIQAESRRMSGQFSGGPQPLTLDLSRPPPSAFGSAFTTPLSAKRQSLTPASPGLRPLHSHRRNTSLSDPGHPKFGDAEGQEIRIPPSPRGLEYIDSPKRMSFAATRSSPEPVTLHPMSAELDYLRVELVSVRAKLIEAQDAREASEDCLRALREFMAEQNNANASEPATQDNLTGLRLPPLPTDNIPDEEDTVKDEPKASGWGGLRLWRQGSVSKSSRPPPSSMKSSGRSTKAPETADFAPSRTSISSTASSLSNQQHAASCVSPPLPSVGAYKKFGLFSSKMTASTDTSSVASISEDAGSFTSASLSSGPGSSGPDSPTEDRPMIATHDARASRKQEDFGELTPKLGHTPESGFAI